MFRHRHVRRLLRWQRDLLDEKDIARAQAALEKVELAWTAGGQGDELQDALRELDECVEATLSDPSLNKPRECFEILTLALLLILALRTFLVQPMAIPSGSMQPTLYGVTVTDLRSSAAKVPESWSEELWQWLVYGKRYFHVVAKGPGKIEQIMEPEPILSFLDLPRLRKQRFRVGEHTYTLWFVTDNLPPIVKVPTSRLVFLYGGAKADYSYQTGEDILRVLVTGGDHILVDRLTYNFRKPRRGEIIVFLASHISGLQDGVHYIKRLVGLGGERIRIGNDRHLRVNGRRLDEKTPFFEQVYGGLGAPADSRYSGHLNDLGAQALGMGRGSIASKFPNERMEFVVRPRHYLVMGDNTVSSYDGRKFGDFAQELVVGRQIGAYWPLLRER